MLFAKLLGSDTAAPYKMPAPFTAAPPSARALQAAAQRHARMPQAAVLPSARAPDRRAAVLPSARVPSSWQEFGPVYGFGGKNGKNLELCTGWDPEIDRVPKGGVTGRFERIAAIA